MLFGGSNLVFFTGKDAVKTRGQKNLEKSRDELERYQKTPKRNPEESKRAALETTW